MADKKITLHPKTNGAVDVETNIYPKTTIDQLYSADGTTPYSDSSFQKPLTAGTAINISSNTVSLNYLGEDFKTILLNAIYPINSIYYCTELVEGHTVCPIQETLGGTWEQIQGCFLLAAGTTPETENVYNVGDIGGSADAILVEHYHSISAIEDIETSETGSHRHYSSPLRLRSGRFQIADPDTLYIVDYASGVPEEFTYQYTNYDGDHKHTVTVPTHNTSEVGESGTGKNMPPYLVVYIWKRIA